MTAETQTRPSPTGSRRCTADRADGTPCRAWAVHGTHPPRCAAHGGGRAPVGAPRGNQNARVHGFYAAVPDPPWPDADPCTIDAIIADLYRKQRRLSRYIDRHMDDLAPEHLARFYSIHAQSSSRLGRLLRDRHILTRGGDDALSDAIDQALAELGEQWGCDL